MLQLQVYHAALLNSQEPPPTIHVTLQRASLASNARATMVPGPVEIAICRVMSEESPSARTTATEIASLQVLVTFSFEGPRNPWNWFVPEIKEIGIDVALEIVALGSIG
jgi:hypothetical protein